MESELAQLSRRWSGREEIDIDKDTDMDMDKDM